MTTPLISHFKKYGQEVNLIQIYSNERQETIIKFARQDKGIQWRIHKDVYLDRFRDQVDIIYVTYK